MGGDGVRLTRSAVETADGPALVHLCVPGATARALVVLGHGAGGAVDAPDLSALATALPAAGFAVARVEQPYRVAGRRTPAPAGRLDSAWVTAVASLRRGSPLARLPLVAGGRSSGARVACRTAAATGAAAVVALAFPLSPPRSATTRLAELAAVPVPMLVVQGSRDPFGTRADFPARLPAGLRFVEVPAADHAFRARRADGRSSEKCLADVVVAVVGWLDRRFPATRVATG